MTPFGFPLMGLFGSIFGGKMGGDKTPDVAAQKRRFGVKNGSTMPFIDRPLLCKKWPLIFNNDYKNENSHKTALWTVKVKKTNKKAMQTAPLSHFQAWDAKRPTQSKSTAQTLLFLTYVNNPPYTPIGYSYS